MGGTNKRNDVIILMCQILVILCIITIALMSNILLGIKEDGEKVRSELIYEASFETGNLLGKYSNFIDKKYSSGEMSETKYQYFYKVQDNFLSEGTDEAFEELSNQLSQYIAKIEISYSENNANLKAINDGYYIVRIEEEIYSMYKDNIITDKGYRDLNAKRNELLNTPNELLANEYIDYINELLP